MKKTTGVEPGNRRGTRRGARWRMLLVPALIGVPVIAVLVYLLLQMTPEPLTSQEILEKKDWSERELTETLARAFAPQSNRGSRKKVLEHLRQQLRNYPPEKQREIRVRALTGAVGETLRQIRAMPEKEQDKMFDAIQKEAEKWHREAQSGEGRKILGQILDSEAGKAFNEEVTRTIYGKFTPEEYRKFAPITDLWIQTLKLP